MSVALKDFIQAENLKPGDRLPPERDLAPKLGLPRTALRRMLAKLESEGQVVRHVGRGTFIAGASVFHTTSAKASSGREALRTYPAEVFEARLIIEPPIAALAAQRASPHEIDEMARCIEKSRAVETQAEFERLDAIFHRTIVKAARNELLIALYERIDELRAGKLWGRMKEQSLTLDRMIIYRKSHEGILASILDRSASDAEYLMRQHILQAKTNILGE
ncbi:FadR/GntR family transcriptional regulator [Bradyrhizobium manausense]